VEGGVLRTLKVFSTPDDPSRAIAEALRKIGEGTTRTDETRAAFANGFQLGRHVPQGLKPAFLPVSNGTAEEAAEKLIPDQTVLPQRLKPESKQSSYRSAEALRHPKSSAKLRFSAAC
jgi:hypothetical protein